jgi:hypothetical protein
MVHTHIYMVHTGIYKGMPVHKCMSLYVQLPVLNNVLQHQTSHCKQSFEPCCIHHPSTVSHILLANPSKFTIYSLTWYIEVHTCIYQFVLCMYIVSTGIDLVQVTTTLDFQSGLISLSLAIQASL